MKKILFVAGLLLPVSAVAVFTWNQDPFNIFALENASSDRGRAAAAAIIRNKDANAAFIGTSRSGPFRLWFYEGMNVKPAINVILQAGSLYETRRYFEYAEVMHPLKKTMIELNFNVFDDSVRPDFSDERLLTMANQRNIAALVSHRKMILSDAYLALVSKPSIQKSLFKLTKSQSLKSAEKFFTTLNAFRYTPKTTVQKKSGSDPMRHISDMIRMARSSGTEIDFYISPLPAERQEDIFGKTWDKWSEWRKDMVRLIEEENKRNKTEVELWDFSGYNSITLAGDPETRNYKGNKWFSDVSHFTTAVAQMMFEKIYDSCKEECEIPEDFGVRLTSENVEGHVEKLARDRQEFLRSVTLKKVSSEEMY